jgi:hypothetical protein
VGSATESLELNGSGLSRNSILSSATCPIVECENRRLVRNASKSLSFSLLKSSSSLSSCRANQPSLVVSSLENANESAAILGTCSWDKICSPTLIHGEMEYPILDISRNSIKKGRHLSVLQRAARRISRGIAAGTGYSGSLVSLGLRVLENGASSESIMVPDSILPSPIKENAEQDLIPSSVDTKKLPLSCSHTEVPTVSKQYRPNYPGSIVWSPWKFGLCKAYKITSSPESSKGEGLISPSESTNATDIRKVSFPQIVPCRSDYLLTGDEVCIILDEYQMIFAPASIVSPCPFSQERIQLSSPALNGPTKCEIGVTRQNIESLDRACHCLMDDQKVRCVHISSILITRQLLMKRWKKKQSIPINIADSPGKTVPGTVTKRGINSPPQGGSLSQSLTKRRMYFTGPFRGCVFALSLGQYSSKSRNARSARQQMIDEISARIEALGGALLSRDTTTQQLLEIWSDQSASFKQSTDNNIDGCIRKEPTAFLLTDGASCRTAKAYVAFRMGVPVLRVDWLLACEKIRAIAPIREFKVPISMAANSSAGTYKRFSKGLGRIDPVKWYAQKPVSQDKMTGDSKRGNRLPKVPILPGLRSHDFGHTVALLEGKRVLLVASVRTASDWMAVLSAYGAHSIFLNSKMCPEKSLFEHKMIVDGQESRIDLIVVGDVLKFPKESPIISRLLEEGPVPIVPLQVVLDNISVQLS